ncbi:M12 family metallo-peptidase [Emticicia sp. BO119]|uniref:M12 family metallo-peptidase n=1 Tax=Emticicia sp. BO119 TaxID=2757768 RepID=UPI0015F01CC0|nr:M12 family metallo-peptidase [Emticicia sp. BO119]MBA4850653.1 hypothetical protein [Emticicia sp. BO119]
MKKIFLVLSLLFVFSTLTAQKSLPDRSCNVNDTQITDEIQQIMQRLHLRKSSNIRVSELPRLECLVAVSVDKEMYDYYKRDRNAIRNQVYEIFDRVSKIYEKDANIKMTVSDIDIWEDRYYTTIGNFNDYWKTIGQDKVKRHLVHMLVINGTETIMGGVAHFHGKFRI